MAWHISLTVRWQDLDGGPEDFLSFCETAAVPFNHYRVPVDCLHSTLFALARVNLRSYCDSMREAALLIFQRLLDTGLLDQIQELPSVRLSPAKLLHTSHTSAVQFAVEPEPLETIRSTMAKLLEARRIDTSGIAVEYPARDLRKNSGCLLWGSIGRNPSPPPMEVLQQSRDISGQYDGLCFTARKALLTISDDALTNFREPGDSREVSLV